MKTYIINFIDDILSTNGNMYVINEREITNYLLFPHSNSYARIN